MKIQIVDNQDQLIGVKERTDIDYASDIYRVSALWLVNSKGQTLLAKRAAVKDKDPGKWGPAVAGTIDEDETYDDNIYKEAMEEIGLEGEQFTKWLKIHVTYPRNYFCQWYSITLDRDTDSFTMQADEVDALEWVDIEQMKQELQANPDKYVPAMQQIVDELGI
jgi:isopentenyl-diphosphate delta-isomerase